ncbi:ABC transporter ATP-binding protein [Paenibacillus albiflavus]|uniref:ABC transporter ATP-binding protein n=1 Tax=Paenibacillus albiflavus TaxID=2545760 RepID=A0A4R4E3Z4_9BACL|nr:ABC transporter ATP-binding protein [Paenibacillus albiflavus]TCZ71068.1 ABC transporter ATP-binding protein [Paenibacillus albiflavus]
METIIDVNGLMKSFGNKTALKNIQFTINKGDIFGFLGPSGSGKTTTVKILTSQILPTSGSVRVFDKVLNSANDSKHMSRIGILTDNSTLYERLTIYDNLELFCKLYDVPTRRIDEVLEAVNLSSERKTVVKNLSKGMKQRVTLARAILHKPELLFLDEPTSALDPVNVRQIHEVLRNLNREGTTIFLTTHDMEEAETLCNRVAFIHDGKISALDTPENLRLQYANNTITCLLKDQGKVIVQQDEEGARRIHDYMTSGRLLSIHSNEPTLGDIFVQITGGKLQ